MTQSLRDKLVTTILPLVQNPAQYIGGELNSIVKEHDGRIKFAIGFPDTYTIGMSHLGIRILYDILNRHDDIVCERVFCPEPDMEEHLERAGIPLFTLETLAPLKSFDIIGFSLQYELCYTNVLTMLHLAQIPLFAAQRGEDAPLIIAGGPSCTNPEPMADFFDAFLLGDGEETIVQISKLWRKYKMDGGLSRSEALANMATEIQGLYVPALYSVRYKDDGRISSISPQGRAPEVVRSAMIEDLDSAPYPEKPLVPILQVIHDRITIEIMRGCVNGCRFCQAGMIGRPKRIRSVERILDIARKNYEATGYDTISLLSLSTSDHPHINEIIQKLNAEFSKLDVGIALPSLRIGKAMFDLPAMIGDVRKSGLTLAPEVATDKQRGVISKMISEKDLYECVREAFSRGWKLVKLYFMFGLPFETQDDRAGIVRLANDISMLGREYGRMPASVNVTVSTFVPKPHTPFQWSRQISAEDEARFRSELLAERPLRTVRLKFGRAFNSQLEGMLSRGDRRLSAVIHSAWKNGARLDAWDDKMNSAAWIEAMATHDVSFEFFNARERNLDEVLPWSHLSYGLRREFLEEEYRRSSRSEPTEICGRDVCHACLADFVCVQ